MWSQLNIKYGYNLKNDCGNVIATFLARVSPMFTPCLRVSAEGPWLSPEDAGRCPRCAGTRSPPAPSWLGAAAQTPRPAAQMHDPDMHQKGF